MKTCDCINKLDDKFREKNLKLVGYAFMMPDFRPVVTIRTEWVKKSEAPKGKKKSPPSMMASYCPFCGVKYHEPKKANTEVSDAGATAINDNTKSATRQRSLDGMVTHAITNTSPGLKNVDARQNREQHAQADDVRRNRIAHCRLLPPARPVRRAGCRAQVGKGTHGAARLG